MGKKSALQQTMSDLLDDLDRIHDSITQDAHGLSTVIQPEFYVIDNVRTRTHVVLDYLCGSQAFLFKKQLGVIDKFISSFRETKLIEIKTWQEALQNDRKLIANTEWQLDQQPWRIFKFAEVVDENIALTLKVLAQETKSSTQGSQRLSQDEVIKQLKKFTGDLAQYLDKDQSDKWLAELKNRVKALEESISDGFTSDGDQKIISKKLIELAISLQEIALFLRKKYVELKPSNVLVALTVDTKFLEEVSQFIQSLQPQYEGLLIKAQKDFASALEPTNRAQEQAAILEDTWNDNVMHPQDKLLLVQLKSLLSLPHAESLISQLLDYEEQNVDATQDQKTSWTLNALRELAEHKAKTTTHFPNSEDRLFNRLKTVAALSDDAVQKLKELHEGHKYYQQQKEHDSFIPDDLDEFKAIVELMQAEKGNNASLLQKIEQARLHQETLRKKKHEQRGQGSTEEIGETSRNTKPAIRLNQGTRSVTIESPRPTEGVDLISIASKSSQFAETVKARNPNEGKIAQEFDHGEDIEEHNPDINNNMLTRRRSFLSQVNDGDSVSDGKRRTSETKIPNADAEAKWFKGIEKELSLEEQHLRFENIVGISLDTYLEGYKSIERTLLESNDEMDVEAAANHALKDMGLEPQQFIGTYVDTYNASIGTTAEREGVKNYAKYQWSKYTSGKDSVVNVRATTKVLLSPSEKYALTVHADKDISEIIPNPASRVSKEVRKELRKTCGTNTEGSLASQLHMIADTKTHIKASHVILVDLSPGTGGLYYYDKYQKSILKVSRKRLKDSGFNIDTLHKQHEAGTLRSFSISATTDIEEQRSKAKGKGVKLA